MCPQSRRRRATKGGKGCTKAGVKEVIRKGGRGEWKWEEGGEGRKGSLSARLNTSNSKLA